MMRLLAFLTAFLVALGAVAQIGPLSFTNASRIYVDVGAVTNSLPPIKNRRDRPFKNLQHALAFATPGDTVELGSGNFETTGSMLITNISVVGRGLSTVITNSTGGYAFQIFGDNTLLEGFTIRCNRAIVLQSDFTTNVVINEVNFDTTIYGFSMFGSSNSMRLRSCEFRSNPALFFNDTGARVHCWNSLFYGPMGVLTLAGATNDVRLLSCYLDCTATNVHAPSGYVMLYNSILTTQATTGVFEADASYVTGYPAPAVGDYGSTVMYFTAPDPFSAEFGAHIVTNAIGLAGVLPPGGSEGPDKFWGTDAFSVPGFRTVPAGGANAAGVGRQIQLNSNNMFYGDSGFIYDWTNRTMIVSNTIESGSIALTGTGAGGIGFADDDQNEIFTLTSHSNMTASYIMYAPTNKPGTTLILEGLPVSDGVQLRWTGAFGYGAIPLLVQQAVFPSTNFARLDLGFDAPELVLTKTNAEGVWGVPTSVKYSFILPPDYKSNTLTVRLNSTLLATNGPNTSNTIFRVSMKAVNPGTTNKLRTWPFDTAVSVTNVWSPGATTDDQVQVIVASLTNVTSSASAGAACVLKIDRDAANDGFGGATAVVNISPEYIKQ